MRERARTVLRWALLILGIGLALAYLNSAAFSAWVSGGPQTPYPEAWLRRAFAHACHGLAALLVGLSLFGLLRVACRRRVSWFFLFAAGLAAVLAPQVRGFLLVDRCLDSGGRWDSATLRCQK